jgi:hypothetical protein
VLPYSGVERLIVPLNLFLILLNKDSVSNQVLTFFVCENVDFVVCFLRSTDICFVVLFVVDELAAGGLL